MFGREEKVSSTRLTAVQYIILAVFLVLAYGLWRLQVMQSDKYSQLAEMNRIRNVPILAPRGKILDREGRVIVDNYPSFSALLLRDSSRDLNADADLIAQGLHLTPEEVRLRLKRFASMPRYQPIFLKEDITPDELAFIESHKNELPELDTIMAHRRLYPRNGFMAHMIGYVGEVTEDMLNQPQFELYNPGDVVGVSGVEKQYNNLLMGKNGSRRAVVDSRGREVSRTAAVLCGHAHDDVRVGVAVGIVEGARVIGVPARDVLLVKVPLRVELVGAAVSGGNAELRQVLLSRLIVRALDVVLTIGRDRQRRGFGRDEYASDHEETPQPMHEGSSRASRSEQRSVHGGFLLGSEDRIDRGASRRSQDVERRSLADRRTRLRVST